MNESEEEVKKTDQSLTIDQAVEMIYNGINVKVIFVYFSVLIGGCLTAAVTYMTVFTGFIPYTEWTCVSQKCLGLLADGNNSESFYSQKSMCENTLQAGVDFNWTSSRTSFSMDWGFYCEAGGKQSVVSSFFFIGAFLGLLSSTAIFDKVGRRNGAIFGSVIGGAVTIAGTWVPSFEWLLAIRVFHGYGHLISYTGLYCWIMEFLPSHLRNPVNCINAAIWVVGTLVIVLIGYLIPVWNYVFLATGILNFLLIIPWMIYPVSPRFSLIRGKEEDARRTLDSWSRICNNTISFDEVTLVFKSHKQNYLKQLKDFKTYPTMRKETLINIVVWFIRAALFYGFEFGWGKLSSNIYHYASYLLSSLGKTIWFSIVIPICYLTG